MRLPAALAPLRHPVFRMLWMANVVVSLGLWMQNTGAGWLMTSLAPDAFTVSLVQVCTIMPVFLLALPAGAIADIVDRRLFILGTQVFMVLMVMILTVMTYTGVTSANTLLMLTFAIGSGAAMNNPAWGSVMAEVVPRSDLVQAITLNGVGFNLARAIGPALAGFLVLAGGPQLAFALNAVSYLAVIGALLIWRRRVKPDPLPRENLLSAIRAGMRFVRHTPTMRSAMMRAMAFFFPCAAPWGLLPLVVKEQLHLGAGTFGSLLGLMGVGGVVAGMFLPQIRARLGRGNTVAVATLCSATGMVALGLASHVLVAALGMLLFGLGWVSAASVAQGAAQLAAPAWVRSRGLAIYQLASNGALTLGTVFWGWLGTRIGLMEALLAGALLAGVVAVAARVFSIDPTGQQTQPVPSPAPPPPEAVAPELLDLVRASRQRVMESQGYRIAPNNRDAFLAIMSEVRLARGRAGAVGWQLYEDVAHPDGWMEVWTVENWTDHLREARRMVAEDLTILARAQALHEGEPMPPSRYLAFETPRATDTDPIG